MLIYFFKINVPVIPPDLKKKSLDSDQDQHCVPALACEDYHGHISNIIGRLSCAGTTRFRLVHMKNFAIIVNMVNMAK